MNRIVDISSDGLHLAVHRGFLTINEGDAEKARIPLDDIGGLITHARGLTWSNTALVRLAERDVPVVVCAPNHAPVSCLWPMEGHHRQAVRMRSQADAGQPLKKRLWQQVVSAKIAMQGEVAASAGADAGAFVQMARRVRSGDPDNMEAQAARRYWPLLMGEDFRRDPASGGANGLLNYGYTVLRATVLRAICAAGLHPTLGIHHANQANAFALADDLMEPYRPLVDRGVLNLLDEGIREVTPDAKHRLATISTLDLETTAGVSPLSVHVSRFVHSFATSLETGKPALTPPSAPPPLALAGLLAGDGDR